MVCSILIAVVTIVLLRQAGTKLKLLPQFPAAALCQVYSVFYFILFWLFVY